MKTVKEREQWAKSLCQSAGMRITPLRKAVLRFLAQHRMPASLEMVSQANGVKGTCDSTTLYRTFVMFKDAGLVRLVPTPQKASYFVLNTPDDIAHFLICRQCGCVTELPLPDTMSAEIKRLSSTRGFSHASQECEIHGLCANCQIERSTQVLPSKLSGGGKTKLRRGSVS
ncbi:MAG TPA: transcriptional repressor [Verrucomicrobiae bacterium]|jgi:Fe2+ or Zn2+ uptake regulation protein|nr:transcriptional repressor [Verrucomicrobiae bacterium]